MAYHWLIIHYPIRYQCPNGLTDTCAGLDTCTGYMYWIPEVYTFTGYHLTEALLWLFHALDPKQVVHYI